MSLLLDIILLLAASLIFVPLAKRYASTAVLGYLIAGLLLGSGGFGLIHDSQLLCVLSELGMLALMFFLGFGFKPLQLWLHRHRMFKDGGVALLLLLLALSALSFMLLQDLLPSLLLGIALAFSSVILVQQLLQHQQQSHTGIGQSALATLQFQLLVVIILIALFPLLDHTASTRHGIAYFAALIATISGVFLARIYLLRPVFRLLSRYKSLELLPVFGLLLILAILLLMDILDIHRLLGAFLVGLLLAESDFKTEIERIVAPFKQIATGLIFLSLGLSLSLLPLFQTPILVLGSIVGLILIKIAIMAAIYLYQHGRKVKASLLWAATLAQSGELGFILLKLAEHEQLLEKHILETALFIIFGSMLMSPLVYALVNSQRLYPWHKKNIAATAEVPTHPILIVGFGRFGQVIARVLHAQGQHFSVIDSNQPDADFIQHYGHHFIEADVTQVENLRAAGIEYCKLLILAIDDVEDSMNLARYLRLNFPDLELYVRARDRHHAHLLHGLGIEHIWRETYSSSLQMAQQALVATGCTTEQAYLHVKQFQRQDQDLLQHANWSSDPDEMAESNPHAMAELEYLFEKSRLFTSPSIQAQQNNQSDVNSRHETP